MHRAFSFYRHIPFLGMAWLRAKRAENFYLARHFSHACQLQGAICNENPNSIANWKRLATYAIDAKKLHIAIEAGERIAGLQGGESDAAAIIDTIQKSQQFNQLFEAVPAERLEAVVFRQGMTLCLRAVAQSMIDGARRVDDDPPKATDLDILGNAFLRKRNFSSALATYLLFKQVDLTTKRKVNIALCFQNTGQIGKAAAEYNSIISDQMESCSGYFVTAVNRLAAITKDFSTQQIVRNIGKLKRLVKKGDSEHLGNWALALLKLGDKSEVEILLNNLPTIFAERGHQSWIAPLSEAAHYLGHIAAMSFLLECERNESKAILMRLPYELALKNRTGVSLALRRLVKKNLIGGVDSDIQNLAWLATGWFRGGLSFQWRATSVSRRFWREELPNLASPTIALDSLRGRTLLVVGFTEAGDEVRLLDFADRLNDISGCKSMTLAVDKRMQRLVSRGRKYSVVGVAKSGSDNGGLVPPVLRPFVDESLYLQMPKFDIVLCLRDLESIVTKSEADLPTRQRVVIPSSGLRREMKRRLAKLGGQPKVGLFWRTHLGGVRRLKRISSLSDWISCLAGLPAVIVDLQFGKEAELDRSNVPGSQNLCRFDGIDMMNNFEALAALLLELDFVISVPSTTGHLAGAVGTPTIMAVHPFHALAQSRRRDSTTQIWAPSCRVVSGAPEDGFSGSVKASSDLLRKWLYKEESIR